MRGYSKMSFTAKSRSMDFSELTQSSPPPPNKDQEDDQQVKMKNHEEENINGYGGVLNGVVLRRNFSSSSSSSSQRIRAPDVLKRAFSMRRSSSVAVGYWRIHDTGDQDVLQEEEDDDEHQQKDIKRSSKRKGMKFFKACKSFFKF